jgi:hypothetical protein
MDLRHLTDKSLLADTKFLAGREREITTKILHHLKEIDKRKLYSDLGYSSLFDYCVKELSYSPSSAYRRIQSARLLEVLPQIEKKFEEGSLNMSNASLLGTFFKENEIKTPSEKMKIIEKIENLSAKDCEKELFKLSGKDEPTKKDKSHRISKDKVRYSLTLSDETTEALDEVKGLLAKPMTMDELICVIAKIASEKLKKEKFHLKKSRDSLPTSEVNRVISAKVKKAVFLRDKKCTQCGSTKQLQYDHRKPFALGGDSSESNVRLLCFNCNQRARIKAGLQNKKGPHSRAL